MRKVMLRERRRLAFDPEFKLCLQDVVAGYYF